MKKNSGSALTSVIVVFLLVTMIGVPLLSMVVYNYRLREYDSGIKEAEYRNEIIMDRISTIIKNEVIAAISEAKQVSTNDITSLTDTLVNSYNSAYDDAIDSVAEYDADGKLINANEVKDEIKEILEGQLGSFSGATSAEIVGILDLASAENFSTAKINEEMLQNVCNNIFKSNYQNILLGKAGSNSIFEAIYNDDEFKDLAISRKYGIQQLDVDSNTNKTKADSLKVAGKYKYGSTEFSETYAKGEPGGLLADFDDITEKLEIRVESNYKLNDNVPLSNLGATFIISTPKFDAISSIEQQTIALSNPVLEYGLIVGETLTLNNSNTFVDGNILTRTNGIKRDANGNEIVANGIVINTGSKLVSVQKSSEGLVTGTGRIATQGDILMDTGSTLETGMDPIYYRSLYLGNPSVPKNTGTINVTFNGDILAKDDLEVNLESNVIVKQTAGSYFGYNDTNDDGPDSSSAIVINSANIAGIKIELKNLYLAGRAFIDGVRSTTRVDKQNKPMIYKTGESISVKGNYIAYQSPIMNSKDYNGDGSGDYDVYKVKFSPYFMTGTKTGIDTDTNLTVNLADNFVQEIPYEDFDSQKKWQYFKEFVENEYASNDSIKLPSGIKMESVKYMEGSGMNAGSVVGKTGTTVEQATMINKGKRFEEFTSYFGYYPEEEANRKTNIKEWINFGATDKKVHNGNFFTYISKANAGNKTLGWGTSSTGANIDIVLPDDTGLNGIIIHDGDLTITKTSNIPFNGMIIVTGNLTINSDITVFSDRDTTSDIIIQNYLGNGYIYNTGEEGALTSNGSGDTVLGEGDLFNSFTYDGSGTTYVAIDVTDRSNMIDINELVGITDWKKNSGII